MALSNKPIVIRFENLNMMLPPGRYVLSEIFVIVGRFSQKLQAHKLNMIKREKLPKHPRTIWRIGACDVTQTSRIHPWCQAPPCGGSWHIYIYRDRQPEMHSDPDRDIFSLITGYCFALYKELVSPNSYLYISTRSVGKLSGIVTRLRLTATQPPSCPGCPPRFGSWH